MNCTRVNAGLATTLAATAWLLFALPSFALPDHLTVSTTNPRTGAPVTLELDRYNLRATNWQCRIYTTPTNYTVLASNQVPEVTTYRGRTSDGGMVWSAVRPNGNMYTRVNYGCRWGGSGNSDPYESSSRYAWTANIQLAYPVITNSYIYTAASNRLVPAPTPPAGWYNNLGATTNFGGPRTYNNMWKMPVNACRLVCSVNQSSLAGTYGNSIAFAIAAVESAVNESDVFAARESGIAFRIEAMGIQTYSAGDVDTSANWSDLSGKFDIMCWVGNWGVSGGTFIISYPSDMGADTWVHELGHSLGGPDFPHELDYQGGKWDTCHVLNAPEMNSLDLGGALAGRRAGNFLTGGGWWYYRSPLPTRANPDFASTITDTPVDVDVLLNDWNVNTTNRADLVLDSVQNPSEHGGTVTDLGNGWVRYTPPAGFRGDDLFRYYVRDVSGNFKSLAGVRVLVADPANPLIGQYSFNETAGTNLFDSSGASGGSRKARVVRGSLDTLHTAGVGSTNNYGAIRLPGVGGGAHVSFGMAVDSAGTPDPKSGYLYDAMDRSQSVSLWYKPDAPPPGGQRHYLYLKDAALYDETAGFIIGIDNTNFFALAQMYGKNQYNPVQVVAGVGPNVPGMWYHLVGEIDRENGQVHLYVNGAKHSSAVGALPAGEFVVGPCFANLGAQNLWGYQGWRPAPAGAFDELRIYSKALTASEVTNLYLAPGLLPANVVFPADAQTNVVLQPRLAWGPGRPTYRHDLYFGTNAAQVAAANTGTPGLYLGRTTNAFWQFTNALAATTTCYWRVDEVDGAAIGTGAVWRFTTGLPSADCDMLSFTWRGFSAAINGTNVNLVVPRGTVVTALNPLCAVSAYATVTPASGSTNTFTSPVNYTVTAQNGISNKIYRVAVTLPPLRAVTLPPGLQAGDQYRLVFVTTNETYGWKGAAAGAFTNFTQYHDFAASEAASVPALNALGTTWKAVVATRTPSSNARANTETDPAANGTGVPIYNLAGQPVALDNADLWDGSILNPINVTQLGTGPTPQRNGQYLVWTGITDDAGNGNGDWSLITPSGNYINAGCATNVNLNWARGMGGSEFKSDLMPIYVMSGILAYPASLTNCDMQSFNWGSYNGVINGTNISLTVPFGTSVTNLNPACTAAAYASISPVSGSARNFSSPLLYTVTAADGVTTKTYLVTVTVAAPSTNCDLLSLNWGAASGSFNGTNITLLVPPGTDVTALNPTCAISPFATSAPLSGTANDFTSPVNYTITAQDGISRKTYQVTARFALSVSVASSSDDAEEAASGSVSLTSSDLELVNDGTAGDQKIGVRFAGLNIPPGWLVASAIIQFTADETQSETTSLTIRAQAADNAPTFSTTNWGISTRPVTSSSVSWQPPAWNTVGEAGPAQQTPDLAALLQEVVNRPGWLEGNAVAFILTGTGHRTADSFDKAGGTPARLIVTFQRPAPPPAVLGIERAGSGALALTWPASHMVFTLYTTTNLPTSNWVRVMADRVLSNGVWILPLGRATNGQRFYRLQTP